MLSKLKESLIKFISSGRFLPIQIDITNACNLSCKHCYHTNHNNSGALDLGQWKSIVSEYLALVTKIGYQPKFVFCGGEPMLSPNLKPLLEFIVEKVRDPRISILTNGTLINLSVISLLKKLSHVQIQVSIDGYDESSHDSVRGEGSFKKSKQGIEFYLKQGFKVNILTILSKRTSSNLPQLFNLAQNLNVNNLTFTRLIGVGTAKSLTGDRPLNSNELRSAYLDIMKISSVTGIQTLTTEGTLMASTSPLIGANSRFWEGIVIDYRGNYLASSRSRLKLGSVLSPGKLQQIFLHHPTLVKLRDGDIEGCKSCEFKDRCGGDRNAAFAASGNFLGIDPGCWVLNEKENSNEKVC